MKPETLSLGAYLYFNELPSVTQEDLCLVSETPLNDDTLIYCMDRLDDSFDFCIIGHKPVIFKEEILEQRTREIINRDLTDEPDLEY